MRRILFILFPALLMLGLFPAAGIPVSDLQKQLAAGGRLTVVDIRSPLSFAAEHVPGAINIPAALCPLKKLPPLGRVVIYGDGLGRDAVDSAASALAAKPGIQVEILEGGFAGWKNSQAMTTRGSGFKREHFNYISYAGLKSVKPGGVVLYDLRKPARDATRPLTDLNGEFPGTKQVRSRGDAVKNAAAAASLVVLVDSGDGSSELEARQLKLGGTHNYVILTGGELILARHGQAGLERHAAGSAVVVKPHAVSATVH